jgi:O-antigen/teichoic acid export membrane protein
MMAINLYAVRFVLEGLGKSGFGLFTTIASVVAITSMLNVVLALSIQRFYSFYLGKKDTRLLNEIFSSSINIVGILAVCAFILLETVGLWLVYTQLTIPPEQMNATLWVYQISIFILILSMLQIPYTAAIFAHEDMDVYTWISTVECLLKFAAALSIAYAFINRLVFYTLGLLIAAIIVFALYVFVARYKYKECHYRKPTDKQIYKKLISFSGWTFFGSAANTGIIQGNTILINIFFGLVINAAFGIAQQINNAFNTLCNTMVLAFRPPMIKAYA